MAEDVLYEQENITGEPEPLEKLYKVVSEKGLYTKSLDEFKSKYSKPEEQDRLYKVVSEQGLYTKGRDEFSKKYFAPQISIPKFQLQTKPGTQAQTRESTAINPTAGSLQEAQKAKPDRTTAQKFYEDANASKKYLQQALKENEDVIPKIIQEGRYLQAKESAFDQFAGAPRSDQPMTAAEADAQRLITPETKPQDIPVTDQDVEEKKKGIATNEAEARQLLAKAAQEKPEKSASIQKAMYLADKSAELEADPNSPRAAKILKNASKIGKGELNYNIGAGGAVQRPEGFLDSIITGVRERTNQMSGYSDVKNMTDLEAADYFDKKRASIDPDEPIPTASGGGAEIGQMLGMEWAPLAKGGVVSAASSLAGNPEAAPFINAAVNAPEYYKRGFYSAFEQTYNQLINEGKPREEAIKIAREQAETEGKLSAVEGAVSSAIGTRIGLKPLPKFNLTGGVKTALNNVLKKSAHYAGEAGLEGGIDGLVAEYLQEQKDKAAKEKGVFRADVAGENFKAELTFSLAMAGVTKLGSAAINTKTYRTLLYNLTKQPEDAIDAKLGEWIQEGKITEEDAKETKAAIQQEKQIQSQIPDNVTEDAREKIRDKIDKRNEIQQKEEKLDDAFKPELKEKIKAINEEIVELSKDTEKPTEEKKLIDKAIEDGRIPDNFAQAAKDNPESFYKFVADQAFGRTFTGEMSTLPGIENVVREQYGDEIVDKAKELFPIKQPETIKPKENTSKAQEYTLALNSKDKEIRADKDFYSYDIVNMEGDKVGNISINYRSDLGGYQVEGSKVNDPGKGIGKKAYTELINILDKPLISDSSLTPSAKRLWESLVKDGLAKYDNDTNKYYSIKPQEGQPEIVIETSDDLDRELAKAIQPDTRVEEQVAQPAQKKPKETVIKEKKAKPVLSKKEQEMADYGYQNSYPFFKKKYPDIDVDEYNRLRSLKAQQPLPKLGEINAQNNTRPANEDVAQYTPKSIIQKAREFYKKDPLINKVLDFLTPIMEANPNIQVDSSFKWDVPEYEGQKILINNQVYGYSFPSGKVILNFDAITDYDTLYRAALHEFIHAATRSEMQSNKAFREDVQMVLSDVRRAMKIPEGDTELEKAVREGLISQDLEGKYGITNEYELLAEVFSNEKFYNYLKGLEYKGDNLLHKLFLAIAKFFSENYKKLVGAKENISTDNLADYLIQLTESVVSGRQESMQQGDALPLIRPAQREVLKNVIQKAIGKISDADIRGKLKQIAGLTDEEVDELMAEVSPPAPPSAPSRTLTTSEIGTTPDAPKRKSRLRRFKEKYFDRAKGMPDYILKLKDKARGSVHLEVRQALQLVDKVKKVAKKIGFDDWELFDKALRGQYYGSDLADLKALPPEMQVLNVQMRNKIDSLSRDLIINNYVTPEQALNIESNIGEYMTRSYRAFNEKDWGKKVPQQARDDAYRFLVQEIFNDKAAERADDLTNGTVTEDELIEESKVEAFRELQSIIDGISDRYVPTKVNVQKGKDTGILKRRKDIPKEIREVLGEYTDPGVNFAMTVARIASLKSQTEYLTSLKNEGMGNIFFEADSRPPEASVQIASEGSETWNPLNGLYTTPDVKEIFKEAENTRGTLLKLWLTAMGGIRWGKTVGSVVTQIKNFESNLGFAVMNGHYRGGKSKESFKFLKDKLFSGEKSQDAMIEKVIGLGIVDQSIGARELRDMFNNDSLDKVIVRAGSVNKSPLKKLASRLGKPFNYLNKVYAASDDFWKVYGFLNEAESLSQATFSKSYKNLTPEEQSSVDTEASERIKNTYPTYDRIWEGTRLVSRNLSIFGNFIAFTAESLRVLLNTFDYAIKDIKTPGRRAMGVQRLAGIGAYLSARSTILYTISQMTGVGMAGLLGMANDDDEDQKLKDINRYSPDFIRSGDKLAIDHGDGNYTVYDVGALEPYGIWFKTMNAYNEGNDIVKDGGLGASATELLSPFVEPEMTFKTGVDIWKNENDFGGRIYNPTDGFGDQTLDAMGYAVKKLRPSTIDFIERIYKKEDKQSEISAAFGGRGYKVETVKQFSFKLKAAEELFDANRDAFNKVKYSPESTEEQIQEAQQKFEERTNKIIKMLSEDYQAAIRLGAKIEGLDEVIDRKKFFQGYNKDVKNQIKSGAVELENPASDEIKEWQP